MSNLSHLRSAYQKHPAVISLIETLKNGGTEKNTTAKGLVGSQVSFVLATVLQNWPQRPHLLIAPSKDEAAYYLNDLEGLLGDAALFFPDSFKRPAFFDDLSANQMLQRSELISKITGGGASAAGKIVVSYPEALFEKVVRPEVLNQSRIEVKKGEKMDVDFVIQVLVEYGFERTDFVFEPGQFSIRGGIIDLFSFGNEHPYRLELFDNEVETIRTFDPATQLSRQSINSLSIVPNLSTRFKQDQKVSLLQILPEDTVIWVKDQKYFTDRLLFCFEQAEKFAARLTALDSAELREIFRDRAFLYPNEVAADLEGRTVVQF